MIKKKAFVCFIIFIVIAVCIPPASCQSSWTVMIYMDGDNNLESAAIDDMNELEAIGSSAEVNIVVQLDRIVDCDSTNGDWTTTRRYYITQDPNGYDGLIVSTLLADLGELNMGDPTTLTNFVTWARTNYPADNYLLVLWDHGDGWKTRLTQITTKGRITSVQKREPLKGVCHDDTSSDYLTMPDLRTALNAATGGGTNPLDVIGFDACLMAMLEVDFEVMPYCSYMVGSEESVPFDGWDYLATMNWLVTNFTCTPDQLASRIVTDYMNFYGILGFETHSAVNLSLTSALAASVSTMATDLANGLPSYFSGILAARDQVEVYMDYDFIDLYHFAQLIQAEIADPQIQVDTQNVMNALTAAVIQEGHGASNFDSHGVSIYFPYGFYSYLPSYSLNTTFAAQTAWDEFLTAYYTTIPPPTHSVAVIDDDSGGCQNVSNVESYYTDALDALSIPYDYYDVAIHGTPSLSYLQSHALVIWFTGSDFSSTLSPADENVLIQYLIGGGNLFFSSQDYVWDLKKDGRYPSVFLRDYLHTTSEVEDVMVNTLTGVTGNHVGDGMGPLKMCWSLPPACIFPDYADSIEKDVGSEYAFFNEDNEFVAITYSGNYKMVFFAFRYEGIESPSDRQVVMERVLDFFGPIPTLAYLQDLFDTNSFFVAGDKAYCTDVLGSAKIAFVLGQTGTHENPEGRTDIILTQTEHDTGNLILIGGPAVNPLAIEFGSYFGITYNYQPGVSFEIFADEHSTFLDLDSYPQEDVCIVYLARHNGRTVMLVWGYGWQGTYAGSVFIGNPTNWQTYSGVRMLMLRWTDQNGDGLVQTEEITVEHVS
ncbi:MAG: clostripain-related cysteine peptidase [Candidatus Methanofastidiosia archaeon]